MKKVSFSPKAIFALWAIWAVAGAQAVFARQSLNEDNDNIARENVQLGRSVEFSLSVKNANQALEFYQGLGFRETASAPAPHPVKTVTDGSIVIALHQASFPSPSVTFFGAKPKEILKILKNAKIHSEMKFDERGDIKSVEFVDLNGLRIVARSDAGIEREGVQFEMMSLAGDNKEYSKCGMFGEFAVSTKSRDATFDFYKNFSFVRNHESNSPHPWGIYVNGITVLGVHQSNDVQTPALTFFAKNSAERIARLKSEGFDFLQELDPKNAILQSPDGQLIFIFTLP